MSDQLARVRIRISHTRTQKAGWQHETTVEIDGTLHTTVKTEGKEPYFLGGIGLDGRDNALYQDIGTLLPDLLEAVDTVGREESIRRNALDQDGGTA